MWAILASDNITVEDGVMPDKTYEEALSIANGRTMIKMTLENSPAYLKGKYLNGKFLPPEEDVNA
jgi:hypothetical protein